MHCCWPTTKISWIYDLKYTTKNVSNMYWLISQMRRLKQEVKSLRHRWFVQIKDTVLSQNRTQTDLLWAEIPLSQQRTKDIIHLSITYTHQLSKAFFPSQWLLGLEDNLHWWYPSSLQGRDCTQSELVSSPNCETSFVHLALIICHWNFYIFQIGFPLLC